VNGKSECETKVNSDGLRNLPQYLTLRQAAETLQVSTATLRRAYHRGELKAFLIGCSLRICRTDLEAWIEAQRWSPELRRERTSRPCNGRRKKRAARGTLEAPSTTPGARLPQ
jgi:excisionase family DNA binding protein